MGSVFSFISPVKSLIDRSREKKRAEEARAQAEAQQRAVAEDAARSKREEEEEREARKRSVANLTQTGPLGLTGQAATNKRTLLGN